MENCKTECIGFFSNSVEWCTSWRDRSNPPFYKIQNIIPTSTYLIAKGGFDTAENKPCKGCSLSVYKSPRLPDRVFERVASLNSCFRIAFQNSPKSDEISQPKYQSRQKPWSSSCPKKLDPCCDCFVTI